MKKFLSVVLAAIMAVSALAVSVVPVMAADTVNSPSAEVEFSPVLLVNGSTKYSGITFYQSEDDPYTYTFVYDGQGKLTGWEHNLQTLGFVSGTDYTATENEDGSLTITFISAAAKAAVDGDSVVVNAIVDMTGVEDADKNDSTKSPDTGTATSAVAGTVALAMAGLAVLSAKKKDAE